MKREQRFRAVLERGPLGWTIARVPFDPAAVWPERVRLRVCGAMNGFGFRSSLFPAEGGGYFLLVNADLQRGGGAGLGALAEFRLEADLEARPAELPDELAVLLDEVEGLRGWYDGLSEYTRREIGKWINGVKGEASRMRRVQQMAERLLATMEAERELPPLVARALAGRAYARAGWERLTSVQRRTELMAVFYYQTPEARQRRLGKLVDVAEKRGRT